MTWGAIGAAGIGAAGSYLSSRDNRRTSTSGGSQGSSGYQQGTYTPNPAAMPMYGFLAGNAGNLMQQPQPFFPGQTYVGPSGPTQQGVNMAMGGMPYYQQGAGLYGQASNAGLAAAGNMGGVLGTAGSNYGFLSNAADVANNPYVQGQLAANKQQVTQALNEDWLPTVNGGAAQVNALGSSRHGVAQAQATERAAQQLANTNASTMLSAYGQGLSAQQGALGQTGNMLQSMMAPAQAQAWAAGQQGLGGALMGQGAQQAGQAGQLVEGYQNNALQDAMDRFYYQYQQPWQNMQNVQGILQSLSPTGVTTNSSVGQGNSASSGPNPNYQNPWQAAIGGGLAGYGIYNQYQQAKPNVYTPPAGYNPRNPVGGLNYSSGGNTWYL